jgi:hypothetical protein
MDYISTTSLVEHLPRWFLLKCWGSLFGSERGWVNTIRKPMTDMLVV